MKVTGAVALIVVLISPEVFPGPRAQSAGAAAPAAPQTAGRGRGPQGPPLLPTPPLTAPPTPDQDGNFVIGPPFTPAPELTVKPGVPQGTVHEFTMDSKDSKIYPGIARNQPGVVVPYKRQVAVYVPAQYVAGTPAPFIVAQDGLCGPTGRTPADPRQPDPREAGARRWSPSWSSRRRRSPGEPAGAGVRHRVGRVRQLHRDGGAPADRQGVRGHVHDGSRRPGDDGRQFGGGLCVHDGVVPSGAVPPRALLLRHIREPAVAAQARRRRAARGSTTTPNSQQHAEADPRLAAGQRERQPQSATKRRGATGCWPTSGWPPR